MRAINGLAPAATPESVVADPAALRALEMDNAEWLPAAAPSSSASTRVERDWIKSWDNRHLVAQRAFHAVREWAYATGNGEQCGLVLWSNDASAKKAALERPYTDGPQPELTGYGVGKSHLAKAAIQYLQTCYWEDRLGIRKSRKPVFLNAVEMLSRIKDCWNMKGRSVDALFEEWVDDALVLDDFGKQYVKGESSAWGAEQFYRLIDGIYQSGQSLLVTSNLTPEEMLTALGGASASRLLELTGGPQGWVNMSALPDWRSRGFSEQA